MPAGEEFGSRARGIGVQSLLNMPCKAFMIGGSKPDDRSVLRHVVKCCTAEGCMLAGRNSESGYLLVLIKQVKDLNDVLVSVLFGLHSVPGT